MWSILSWVVFGALAGWVAGLITKDQRGCIGNIVVGIVGAFLGGYLMSLLTGVSVVANPAFNIQSFIVAVIGAVVLLLIVKFVRRR
jgi:uncharacterized membrane protein YeaQ/YmgE (transglycosylase-associated protein family)